MDVSRWRSRSHPPNPCVLLVSPFFDPLSKPSTGYQIPFSYRSLQGPAKFLASDRFKQEDAPVSKPVRVLRSHHRSLPTQLAQLGMAGLNM